MMWVVAPQSTSRAFGFPVALSLACSTSSSGSLEVPEAFFTLSVLFFPLRSYDTCCTSVRLRFFSCLYYNRSKRYVLVGHIENRWHAIEILASVQSSWLSDFRLLCLVAQCLWSFARRLYPEYPECLLFLSLSSELSVPSIIRRLFVKVSLAFLKAVAKVLARMT